jgi:integrase/recombinase XerC/integrase/recombinase XerD
MLGTRSRNVRWVGIDMAEVELDKLIVHFAQCNKVEGKSPRTVAWYSEMLHDFVRFMESEGCKGVLSEFDMETVRDFVAHEQERGISPYTVQGKVRALKAFSSWLFREAYMSGNLLANFKLPRVPKTLIEPLTSAEIDQLVNCQNPLTAVGCRDIAILIVMLDTGIRLSELCGLRFEDAHIEEGYLKVMGKGSKERIVPVGASAQKMLWRYIIHFRPEPMVKSDNYLFLTLDGKPLRGNAVELLIKRWGKRAGVPRLHAHLCRHTFATNYLIYNCGDVFRLQQILGHSSLEMVRRYVHYASSQSLINGKILSPVDQMGIKKLRSYKIDQILSRTGHPHQRGTKWVGQDSLWILP